MVLVSILGTASPVLAAPAKNALPAKVTIIQTPAVEQAGHSQRCDQLEDTEAISATYSQPTAYGQVVLIITNRFHAPIYPAIATRLPSARDNAHIQPFYQLILFPFHVFW